MSRSTWTIPSTRWHARVYNNWKLLGSFKKPSTGYRENLCHYWRIVLFWGWVTRFLCWFIEAKTVNDPYNRNHKLPPAIPILVGAFLLAFIAGLYGNHPWELATILFIGIPLAVAAIGFGVYYSLEKYEAYKHGDISPNIVLDTVISKKHKVCPFIEVEEPPSKEPELV